MKDRRRKAAEQEAAASPMARALRLDPEMGVSNVKDRLVMLQPEHFAQYAASLHEAGLSKKPRSLE